MIINEFLAGVLTTVFLELLISMALIVKSAFSCLKEGFEDETTEEID